MKTVVISSALVVALALCAGSAFAQYNPIPAGSGYAPIANLPGAVQLMGLSGAAGCDDCTEVVNLSFSFPWFVNTTTNAVSVSSNGAINIDPASTTTWCCSAYALDDGAGGGTPAIFAPESRISVFQEDLDPAMNAGAIWSLDTGSSMIISYEDVSFFPGPASGTVQAQVEIFVSGDIEIRYGTTNNLVGTIAQDCASGLSDFSTGTSIWVSPMAVVPEFNMFGQTTGGVVPQNTGCFFQYTGVLPAFPYQVNSAEASLDIDGVLATALLPAATTVCVNQTANLSINSSLPGTPFELAVAAGPVLPSVITTAANQVVNINPGAILLWLGGGAAPVFIPVSNLALPVSVASPVTASAQMVLLAPGTPDGFILSQASQLDVVNGSGLPIAGPASDDGFLQVTLAASPACGPASVPFCGTSYTDVFINSNGRLTFGAGDGDFSATLGEAQTGVPFFGAWGDYSPNVAGTVDYAVTATDITATWNAVPYFAEATTTNTFSLAIDIAGTATIDVNGITANPLTATTTSDSMFLGLSCGIAATDPGITAFAPGGSGANVLPTDMIYDFVDSTAMAGVGGLLPSITALQGGAGQLVFSPGGGGNYIWAGF